MLEGAQAQVDGALPIRPIGQEYVESPGSVVLQVQLRRFKLGQWVPFVLPPTEGRASARGASLCKSERANGLALSSKRVVSCAQGGRCPASGVPG